MQPIAAISPADVLQDVIDDLALPEEVRITCKVDRGKVQMGHADLQRVFHVLISNAVRFHPKQAPRVEVSAGPEADGFWVINVIDDGDGIPENKRDFVLRPMTKLVSRDVDPGAGMGLAVLRKIAWTYGGEVEVLEPKSGKGTHVRVRLLVN